MDAPIRKTIPIPTSRGTVVKDAHLFRISDGLFVVAGSFSKDSMRTPVAKDSYVKMLSEKVRLPFRNTVVKYERELLGIKGFVLSEMDNTDENYIFVAAAYGSEKQYTPVGVDVKALRVEEGADGYHSVVFPLHRVAMEYDPHAGRRTDLPDEYALGFIRSLCDILAIINSPNIIEKETTDYSKLNKKRIKQGKPPLPDVTTITIKREILKELKEQEEAEREPGAKKRLHWRRGHFKHMPTGTFWYSACLVGSGPMIEHDYVA